MELHYISAVEAIKKLFESGIQFAAAIFLLDVTGNSADPGGRGFTDGDPDATYYPVKGSLKKMPWHKDNLAPVSYTHLTLPTNREV